MNVRKFIAANAREALRRVKEMLGPDAIILSNRDVAGGVEIMAVAARDMAMIVPPPAAPTDVERRPQAEPLAAPEADDDYQVYLSPRQAVPERPASQRRPAMPPPEWEVSPRPMRQAAEPAARSVNGAAPQEPHAIRPAAAVPPAAEVATAQQAAVMEELRALREIVEQHLAGFAWRDLSRDQPVKTGVLKQMLDAGFSPAFSRQLLAGLPEPLHAAGALSWAQDAAVRALTAHTADNDIIDRGGVYALVGPTGVGKTTTTAKVAARCVLRYGASRVALISTDGYRIGAHEQLRIYGRILGVPVYTVKDGLELKQVLRELSQKHIVLIDTMGMSQRDRHVADQTAMLGHCDVRRLLLMSATSRGDTLDDVVRAYGGDGLAGCILTKIDEAIGLAASLDAIIRHRLPLCYVSNGQRVPEDLHLANKMYLIHRAFKVGADRSPHRFDGVEPALMMAGAGAFAVGANHA